MSTPTTTASTDLGYSLESDLPVIPALANIDYIRVIDKQGASYQATPAQMREMVSIDYSLLTEQIVPGEYAVNYKGARRQVYARGISLSATVTAGAVPTMPYRQNIGLSSIVGGIVSVYTKAVVSPIYRSDSDCVVIISEPEQGILNINVRGFTANQLLANSTLYISGYIKYTK